MRVARNSSIPSFAAIANRKPIDEIKNLLNKNANEFIKKDCHGNNIMLALYDPAHTKPLFDYLACKGVLLSEANNAGFTPSHLAVIHNNRELLNLLMNVGAGMNNRSFQF